LHGEPPTMEAFAARLDAPRAMMPRLNEQVEIG